MTKQTSGSAKPLRLAVALSGGGRTLLNLLRQSSSSYEVVGVITSSPNCGGVQIAADHHLPIFMGDFRQAAQAETSKKLAEQLASWNVDWIVLAGFLKPFPIMSGWRDRIINIHPALLPRYGGKGMYGHHVHEAVLAAGDSISGATVHFVNERYDDGLVIAQVEVDIAGLSTADAIAQAVFEAECDLYPKVLERLNDGVLPQSDGKPWRYRFKSMQSN